ncbi:MAG: DUF805 domain-containing protein [Thermoguttaceae bacterium]|nr:DUF805 domain-containing protein [Thermoguttaceae bacterium]
MFYIRVDGVVYGPYTEETLRGYAAEGRIVAESEVSPDGANWHRAGEIPGLFASSGPFSLGTDRAAAGGSPTANTSLFRLFIGCWGKFATIRGRATRREFFAWFLVNSVITFLITLLSLFIASRNGIDITQLQKIKEAAQATELLERLRPLLPYFLPLMIYTFAAALPNICVTIRRLHDLNLSGWWLLLFPVFAQNPILGPLPQFLLLIIPGTPSDNRFGPDPRR